MDLGMRRVSQFISLLLVALWLPAALHCGLERAGLPAMDSGCATNYCSCDSGVTPGCESAAAGAYKVTGGSAKVMPPALVTGGYFLCLELVPSAGSDADLNSLPVMQTEVPRDWIPIWQFVRRAAPPSRAPSPLLA